MANEKANPSSPHGFALDLDESLIADALAAVEKRMAPPPKAKAPAAAPAEPGGDIEIDVDALDLAGSEEDEGDGDSSLEEAVEDAISELGIDLDVEPQDFAEALDDGGLDFEAGEADPDERAAMCRRLDRENARLSAERQALEDEVAALRQRLQEATGERDEAQQKARDALRKAGMMVVKARRKDEALEQLRLDLEDAREMVRQRDGAIQSLRTQSQDAERERSRLKARMIREVEDSKRFSNEKLLKSLLPVLDHMELALEHADADADRIREGVSITWNQLLATLTRSGLSRIDLEPGAPFDPEHQEAMEYLSAPEFPPNQVVRVHQNGYLLSGRLLRAARVSVSAEFEHPDDTPPSTDGAAAEGDAEGAAASPSDDDAPAPGDAGEE